MNGHFTPAPTARLVDAAGFVHPLTAPDAPQSEAELLRAALAAAPDATFCIAPPELHLGPAQSPPAFETLTGGTTGAAKRIRRTQQSWIASFEVNAAAWGIGPDSEVAALGSLAYSLTLYAALEALHTGAGFHLLTGPRPDRQQARLAARGVSLLWGTPAQLRLLSGPPAPSVARVLIGGGALDAATEAHARSLFPAAELLPFYGAAETSFITLGGRPYPGVEIDIREADADGIGEVWVRSPYLFDGYASAPDPHRDARGFTTVGERGRLLPDGTLRLAGRADRAVRIAEQTVQPEEVEAALMALSGVAEAAVLPVPDPARGTVLTAAYVATDTTPPESLLAEARTRLGPLATPRALTPIAAEDWPRRPSGKTDLAALATLLKVPA